MENCGGEARANPKSSIQAAQEDLFWAVSEGAGE